MFYVEMIALTSFGSGELLRWDWSSTDFFDDNVRRLSGFIVFGSIMLPFDGWPEAERKWNSMNKKKIRGKIRVEKQIYLTDNPLLNLLVMLMELIEVLAMVLTTIKRSQKFVQSKIAKQNPLHTSWSPTPACVSGAGDVGSGVFAPLESIWLSMRRFARDRVLHGNFRKVENFFRSSK